MRRDFVAYLLSALSAPLVHSAAYVVVLGLLGPHHFFDQGGLWDWLDFAAKELGFVIVSGIVPALLFLAPIAWWIARGKRSPVAAALAGATGGLAFAVYAAANGHWAITQDVPSWQALRLPLFWFVGSDYGDVLAFAADDHGTGAILYLVPPVVGGAVAAGAFWLLNSDE